MTATRRGSLDGSGPSAEQRRAQLYLLLEAHQPLAPAARFALDTVDEVVVGRGDERRVELGERGGKRRLVLQLDDPWMSTQHATLVKRLGRWTLHDAGSTNGVLVDGERVAHAALGDRGTFELGRTFFRFRAAVPSTAEDAAHVDATELGVAPPGLRTLVPSLARAFARLGQLAASTMPLVFSGEIGTGKELAARAVHALSGRAGPFVAVACGALPQAHVETELFGHREGAFPGAAGDRSGLIRAAHGGTLFLDEIADLSRAAQAALVRVLQEHEVRPVGDTVAVRVDLRLCAATNGDLAALAASGVLRADLLARLSGLTFALPPLRERLEDLGLLAGELLARLAPERAAGITFHPRAVRALLAHAWPGNVRELERSLAAALVLAGEGGVIDAEHLSAPLPRPERAAPPSSPSTPVAGNALALVHEGDTWAVTGAGRTVRLKDSKGMQLVAHLVAHPGVEVHVLDLMRAGEGPFDPRALGDAGELLDGRAKAAYKERLADLRVELDEAEGFADQGRAARLRGEIEALTDELARGVGLGGRDRKAASAAERARVNVQRRISDALQRIEEQHPDLGRLLSAAIRTGTFCRFMPWS